MPCFLESFAISAPVCVESNQAELGLADLVLEVISVQRGDNIRVLAVCRAAELLATLDKFFDLTQGARAAVGRQPESVLLTKQNTTQAYGGHNRTQAAQMWAVFCCT